MSIEIKIQPINARPSAEVLKAMSGKTSEPKTLNGLAYLITAFCQLD